MTQAYRAAVAWLADLEANRGWDLGVARMERALGLLGNPHRALRVLHVAGTNGKGTAAAVMESVLRAAGYRTGLYTSPHLVDFAERIRAGGGTIPEGAVVALVDELRTAFAREGLALTHFEFVTALAFVWMARIGVDVAVVEVGLGGRLDATNVVAPLGTAITSIARDHEAFLGDSLAMIAREKAGIVKTGVPVSIGPLPVEAERVVSDVARARRAPLWRVGVDGRLGRAGDTLAFDGLGVRWTGLHPPFGAPWQLDCLAVALLTLAAAREALPVAGDAVRRGVAEVSWPGRLMALPGPPPTVLDGAHNPAGVRALAAELPRVLGGARATIVFGCGRDRPWDTMVGALAPFARAAIVTEAGRRPAPAEALAEAFGARAVPVRVEAEPARAVERAIATAGSGPVLVTGSLFLVGDALRVMAPPRWAPWNGWGVGATQAPR